jgi:GDPmannose 4,6-dehydratase
MKHFNNEKVAIIFGATGQDGSYLAKSLIDANYKVYGVTRNSQPCLNHIRLKIQDKISLIQIKSVTKEACIELINELNPDEIYNLMGPSSVAYSFENPKEAIDISLANCLSILEAIRLSAKINIKFFNASSTDCYGDINAGAINEDYKFSPKSPYASGKASCSMAVDIYRNAYGLYAVSGILSNHESVLRGTNFVTMKCVHAAKLISQGKLNTLELGNISIKRDWGWAEEYVEAMRLMLENPTPQNYIIATGKTVSLEYFVDGVFRFFDMDYKNFIQINKAFIRPNEISEINLDAQLIKHDLGWKATSKIDEIIVKLCTSSIN